MPGLWTAELVFFPDITLPRPRRYGANNVRLFNLFRTLGAKFCNFGNFATLQLPSRSSRPSFGNPCPSRPFAVAKGASGRGGWTSWPQLWNYTTLQVRVPPALAGTKADDPAGRMNKNHRLFNHLSRPSSPSSSRSGAPRGECWPFLSMIPRNSGSGKKMSIL